MRPKFWKLSQGTEFFDYNSILESIEHRLVYVHKDTAAKGGSRKSQGQQFIEAPVGDYFYLTHGNAGIYLLGQFTGPTNIFSARREGWLDRPFRFIKASISKESYNGPKKWWTPNEDSTFSPVPDGEVELFEQYILQPYFNISLSNFGL